ncbi:hypothetical protein FOIG_16912 [Fusarium odoratissimum NRRL 54006]|uniref:Uncharacterized protein n=1 Tax=Fusarium odoratissimum (strain NRRL 54006) TaxID=1089451 RepID=X0JY85_FUSO5|nr:uncharacterized protein FOIG_16912 [Fusarium odoratissimum NRRL 54006]EXL89804.1 hypothetical protein FOIG_16912 [Fusarium odoratissimum NRRL 54006]
MERITRIIQRDKEYIWPYRSCLCQCRHWPTSRLLVYAA